MTSKFSAKDPAEIIPVKFDFAAQIGAQNISTAVVNVSVQSGSDNSPSAIKQGSATISGTEVTQWLTGGIAGNTYHLRCVITTNGSETRVMSADIPVSNF